MENNWLHKSGVLDPKVGSVADDMGGISKLGSHTYARVQNQRIKVQGKGYIIGGATSIGKSLLKWSVFNLI